MDSKSRFRRLAVAITISSGIILFGTGAWCVEEDSAVARNLYSKPLTHRETPPGYRNKPIQYTPEPRGFKDNPHNWTSQPMGFAEKPLTQLEEPRNGYENPFTFVARDATLSANLDDKLKATRDQNPAFNGDTDLKIPISGVEDTSLNGKIEPRNPGYKGINPPNKARLQSFQ